MKRTIFLLTAIFVFVKPTLACDICGCGVGSYYIGILPDFNKKIMGLRYRYNSLQTHLGAGGESSYLTTNERYRTAELWGGWTIKDKFRVMASVPFNINDKTNQGNTRSKTGLGDVSVQGFYQVLNTRKVVGSKLHVHSLWAGAGLKFGSGRYDVAEKTQLVETANIFQLGTGSTDFTFNLMYDYRVMDAGLNSFVSYKVNTSNRENYRYGNKLSANLQGYYKFRVKNKYTISPNTGLGFEMAGKDLDDNYRVDVSGGRILMYTLGTEILLKKMSIGGNWQMPIAQDLAGGFVKANNRVMIHVSFMF